jgi:hypothetical protein
MLKIEFFDLVFFEQRHYDIDSGITQRPNLVFEPIPTARPRHDPDAPGLAVIQPVNICPHTFRSFLFSVKVFYHRYSALVY